MVRGLGIPFEGLRPGRIGEGHPHRDAGKDLYQPRGFQYFDQGLRLQSGRGTLLGLYLADPSGTGGLAAHGRREKHPANRQYPMPQQQDRGSAPQANHAQGGHPQRCRTHQICHSPGPDLPGRMNPVTFGRLISHYVGNSYLRGQVSELLLKPSPSFSSLPLSQTPDFSPSDSAAPNIPCTPKKIFSDQAHTV